MTDTGKHRCALHRYPRGSHPVTGRTAYGYHVKCACGWDLRVNGTKREAERAVRDHEKEHTQ